MKTNIVFATGTFDILHRGHIIYLLNAKSHGNYLIVGLNIDKFILEYKHKLPIMSYEERAFILSALRCIDRIVPQNKFFDIKQLKKLKVNTLVIGAESIGQKQFKEAIKLLNIQGIKIPYTHGISSTGFKKKIRKG